MDKNKLNSVGSLVIGLGLIAGGIWLGQSLYKKNRILGGTVGGVAGLIATFFIPAPKLFGGLGSIASNFKGGLDDFDGIRRP